MVYVLNVGFDYPKYTQIPLSSVVKIFQLYTIWRLMKFCIFTVRVVMKPQVNITKQLINIGNNK